MAYFQCINQGGGTGNVADVEVNGESVLNPTTKIAEITSYKEVTLAEYEAIPVVERESDGILYCIKDIDNDKVQGYPPLIYSDEEREIGVWRDGKPLYQKTLILRENSVDKYSRTGSTYTNSLPLNVGHINLIQMYGLRSGNWVDCMNLKTETALCFDMNNNGVYFETVLSYSDLIVTIEYTKTTDTAGSGIWNGQGGTAHHYSTNETVVGTWIDGKPLYERVFTAVSIPNDSYTSDVDLGVLADEVIKVTMVGTAIVSSNTIHVDMIYAKVDNGVTTVVHPTSNIGASITNAKLSIQYTKTTD